MKRVVLLSILFISVHAFSQTTVTTYHDYFKTQKYEVYTAQPNTNFKIGAYKRYDQKGTLIEEATYSNNRLNGVRKVYYDSGTANAHSRPTDYYGKLFAVENYKDGVLQGAAKDYQYVNGKQVTLREFLYRDGKQVNLKEYYLGKEIVASVDLENGECYRNFKDGKRKSTFKRVNGNTHGRYVEYFENGKVFKDGEYTDGEQTGTWKKYYENGVLAEEIQNIIDGNNKVALSKEYTEDAVMVGNFFAIGNGYQKSVFSTEGKPISETIYTLTQKGWTKNGVEKIFEDGVLSSTTTFVDEKEQGPIRGYYPNGKVSAEGNMESGKVSGLMTWYDEEGRIDQTGEFNPSDFKFLLKTYYPSGKLKSEGYYAVNGRQQVDDCKFYHEDGSLDYIKDAKGNTRTAQEIEKSEFASKIGANKHQSDVLYQKIEFGYGGGTTGKAYYAARKSEIFIACAEIRDDYLKKLNQMDASKESCELSATLVKVLDKGAALINVETKDIEKRLRKAKALENKIAILSE